MLVLIWRVVFIKNLRKDLDCVYVIKICNVSKK